jgi:hypothetical protein
MTGVAPMLRLGVGCLVRRTAPVLPVFRRFVVLLIALVLFAPGSAIGRVLYACSMSGKISAGACCCHKAKVEKARAEQGQAAPTRLERPDCCEAQEQRATTVASYGAAEVQVLAAAPGTMLPAIEPAAAAGDVMRPLPHMARGPPHSLAIYVTNCSLLI